MKGFILIVLASLLSFCQQEQSSEIKIINGHDITDRDDLAQGVFLFGGGCTATAVSTTTILTAAHCVSGGQYCVTYKGKKECTSKGGAAREYGGSNMKFDIAVAVFDKPIFKEFHPIQKDGVKEGDELILVGFSPSDEVYQKQTHQGMPKRWGINTVAGFQREMIFSETDRTADKAGLNGGDSGGPAFNDRCELVGIASNVDPDKEGVIHSGRHTNVALEETMKEGGFFSRVKDSLDAQICGYNGDAEHCPKSGQAAMGVVDSDDDYPCLYGDITNQPNDNDDKNDEDEKQDDQKEQNSTPSYDIKVAQGQKFYVSTESSILGAYVCVRQSTKECAESGSEYTSRKVNVSGHSVFIFDGVPEATQFRVILIDENSDKSGYSVSLKRK